MIALILAAAGVFAVVAHAVIRRTRELAVRVAVGATARDLTRAIVPAIAVPIAVGLVAGLAAAIQLASYLRPMLFYEVSPTSPEIYAAATAAFLLAATVATWLPLRRAWRLDPAVTLRQE
ncbi:MAG: FtsX-like permease family protein [Vicinamibacterales bacterium]